MRPKFPVDPSDVQWESSIPAPPPHEAQNMKPHHSPGSSSNISRVKNVNIDLLKSYNIQVFWDSVKSFPHLPRNTKY